MKLYMPGRGDEFSHRLLGPVLTRPIRWDIIANNYDMMMKYATAIRLHTATTEALLRRFTSETTHPAYAAMLEVGAPNGRSSLPANCEIGICSARPSPG